VAPVSPQSSIVELKLLETQPERGEDFLNALLDIYGKNYVEFKRRIAGNTLEFVDDRLNLISQELNTVEKNLQEFKSKEGIVDISTEGQIYLNEVSEFDRKLAEINVQI